MPNSTHSYFDWTIFSGDSIPSSLNTYPILYEKISSVDTPSILDIGSGFGKTCFEIANTTTATLQGVDINQNGVAYANDLLRLLPINIQKRLNFETADALSLPFQDSSFNIVVMQALLTTLTTPLHRSLVLSEARRVTDRHGGIYIADFIQTWHIKSLYDRYIIGLEECGELGSFFAYNETNNEKEYQAHHYNEKELVDLVNGAGFEIKHFEYHKFLTRTKNIVNGVVIWAE